MRHRTAHRPIARRQRGVAALVVVMVLFFIITLVAAYTNRNLIFEQRTSANQYRSTQAYEAAQAGVEWAIAMLNGGRVDATCQASSASGDASFRDRNLAIDASGMVTSNATMSACVFNGTSWSCSCPASGGTPVLTAPTGSGVFPAYKVRFVTPAVSGLKPGVVRIEVLACPKWDATSECFNFASPAGEEGRATVSALVALYSGLKTPPSAALIVKGTVAPTPVGGESIKVYNANVTSGGLALVYGGALDGATETSMLVQGPAGTPRSAAYAPDAELGSLAGVGTVLPTGGDQMFARYFGVTWTTYRDQPATIQLDGPVDADTLSTLIGNNPGRPIWINGNLQLDATTAIGSVAQPAVVIVTGNLTLPSTATPGAPPVPFHGLMYVRNATWTSGGGGNGSGNPVTIQGATIAEGNLAGTGTGTYVYDAQVLDNLRLRSGSFVLVPGSWRDF